MRPPSGSASARVRERPLRSARRSLVGSARFRSASTTSLSVARRAIVALRALRPDRRHHRRRRSADDARRARRRRRSGCPGIRRRRGRAAATSWRARGAFRGAGLLDTDVLTSSRWTPIRAARGAPRPIRRCSSRWRSSGSRGVMRVDDAGDFVRGVRAAAATPAGARHPQRARRGARSRRSIESFIPGVEFAIEGVMTHGASSGLRHFRQARSARRPVFRGNDLRHALARSRRSISRRSSTQVGRGGAGARTAPRADSRRMPREYDRCVCARGRGASDWRPVLARPALRRSARRSSSPRRGADSPRAR